MMGEPVVQGRAHLGVAEHERPFAEGEVCDDDDRGSLVEPAPAQEVAEQLASSLCERQVAELVEDGARSPRMGWDGIIPTRGGLNRGGGAQPPGRTTPGAFGLTLKRRWIQSPSLGPADGTPCRQPGSPIDRYNTTRSQSPRTTKSTPFWARSHGPRPGTTLVPLIQAVCAATVDRSLPRALFLQRCLHGARTHRQRWSSHRHRRPGRPCSCAHSAFTGPCRKAHPNSPEEKGRPTIDAEIGLEVSPASTAICVPGEKGEIVAEAHFASAPGSLLSFIHRAPAAPHLDELERGLQS